MTTRRTILDGMAAAPAADPIFAAIERLRAADEKLLAAEKREDELIKRPAAARAEAKTHTERLGKALRAEIDVFTGTVPLTLAGARAGLAYALEFDERGYELRPFVESLLSSPLWTPVADDPSTPAAPAAGVPAAAAATQGTDPVLSAIAEWREQKALADADAADLERIEDAYQAETERLGLVEQQISLEDFDLQFWAFSDAPEVRAFRNRVEKIHEARQAINNRLGVEAAREKAGASGKAAFEAMCRVPTVTPTSAEGAFALLEFTAFWIEEGYEFYDGEHKTLPARAIRAALAVLQSA